MKVIVAIDQTINWKQVLEAVLKRHWPKDTSFKIISVVEPMQWEEFDGAERNVVVTEVFDRRHSAAQDILQQARKLLFDKFADCSVHIDLRHGSPRAEIVDAAAEWMADQIVVGAHGHSPNRLFTDTVPRSIARRAHCSVELVRLRRPSQAAGEEKDKVKSRTVSAPA